MVAMNIDAGIASDTEDSIGIFGAVQGRKAVIRELGLGKMSVRKFFGAGGEDMRTISAGRQIFARGPRKAAGRI